MTIKVHHLKPAPGSTTRRKRVARGIAGRGGKTAGRGMKGQKARSKVAPTFEGGQMPLHMRLPKLRGFNNPFRLEYQAVNLDTIEESGLDEVTPESLHSRGLVRKGSLVKVLARGEIRRSVRVEAHAFSRAAAEAIEAAGGSVVVRPKPWGDRRRPAQGSQFTNR